jgi:hypothetical protein
MSSLLRILTFSYWKRSSLLCEIRRFSSFFRLFKSCSQNLSKIFEFFFLTMLISLMRNLIFFEINTFKNAFLISKKSFDKFNEWEQRKLFFWKKKSFSLFNYLIFSKNEVIFCFSLRHFVSIFRLSQND